MEVDVVIDVPFAIRCYRLLRDLTISIVHLQIFVDLKCDLPNLAAAIDRYVHVGFHRPCRNYDSFLSKFLKTFVDGCCFYRSKLFYQILKWDISRRHGHFRVICQSRQRRMWWREGSNEAMFALAYRSISILIDEWDILVS